MTSGEANVKVEAATLGELAVRLEAQFPGLHARLVDGDRIRPGMAVFVNSVQVAPTLDTKISDGADIYFAPAISGGTAWTVE